MVVLETTGLGFVGGWRAVSMGADTKANTLRGGGLPEGGDLRLLEDGSERGGALVSNVVAFDTVSEGGMEMGRE